MPTFLEDLEIDEISFVDAGANQHAKIVLYKRATPAEEGVLSPEQIAAMFPELVTKAGRKISAARLATLADLRDALAALIADTTPADKEPPMDETKKADLTKLSKAAQDVLAVLGVTELTADNATLVEAALPKPAIESPKPVEDVLKSASPELRALVEKAQADVAKAQAEAAEASKIAKAERDQRVTREFIAKAQTLDALPGMNADDFGVVLKGVAEKAPEEWLKLEPLLKSAHAAIKAGALYGEKGRGGEGGGSAEAEINAKAAEIVAKSATKLSLDEAKIAFLETTEGKALYQRYLDDNPAQTGRR